MAYMNDAETVKESEISDFKETARETLEDIFARVDLTLSRANVSGTALGKGGDAHDALIAELTAALDEVRGKWRKAEVEMRTYSQATGGSAMAQMPSELATLTSRAELAEAQARRAEKAVQTLKAEVRAWRSSANSEQLDLVKESLASEEALAVTAGPSDEEEVSTLRKRLADAEAAHSKLQSEVALTRVELASARSAPKPSEDQAKIVALQQEIGTLNQQMAHLFTELTFARTELAQHAEKHESASELAQVPELLQDMRHLQLDLEYHQQKLDQVLEENRQLLAENKQHKEQELALVQAQDEQQQELRHLEIELSMRASGNSTSKMEGDPAKESELRKDVQAKEGLLTKIHYELHKEKLARQRAEQRAAKLRDRLEKLMKVVEHQRDAVRQLEGRALSAEAQANDRSSKLKIASNQVSRLQQLLGTNQKPVVPADRGQAF
jgi:chromosome segregation ATPase